MNSEPEHLASAYLDGELTDEERHLAEGDPAVMAEVESLRALRDRIASAEAPTHEARESAIAAAMAAFHQLHATADSGGPGRAEVTDAADTPDMAVFRARSERRAGRERRDLSRWLGVAAAVVVAAALGIVAVQARGGGNDDSVADQAASEPAATSAARVQADELDASEEPADDLMVASEISEEDAADGGADAESSLADAPESADAPTGEVMAEEAMTQEMTAEATAEASASETIADDAGATSPTASTIPLPDPARYFDDDDALAIESPVQLQSAASYLIGQRDAGELGPTPEYRCPFPFVLARAVYRVGTTAFDVLIDVDELTDTVSAVDEPTCNVIATSPIEPTGQP